MLVFGKCTELGKCFGPGYDPKLQPAVLPFVPQLGKQGAS